MEFKDYLKMLREERKISQQGLADAIFVSRSAVAKWENGLGIPNVESYRALLTYFQVTEEQLPLCKEKNMNEENSKSTSFRWIWRGIAVTLALLLTVGGVGLYRAMKSGFGFTSEAAAGKYWADNLCIQTPEYDFYCSFFTYQEDPYFMISGFIAVQKKGMGYQRLNISQYAHRVEGAYSGTVYSFPADDGFYHVFIPTIHLQIGGGNTVPMIEQIRIKEDMIEVQYHRFFKTNFALYEFYINEELHTVV